LGGTYPSLLAHTMRIAAASTPVLLISAGRCVCFGSTAADAFASFRTNPTNNGKRRTNSNVDVVVRASSKGFGSRPPDSKKRTKKKKKVAPSSNLRKGNSLSANKPYVKSEQDELLASITAKASQSCLGRAVSSCPHPPNEDSAFWSLVPALVASRFPRARDDQLTRVGGFLRHALDPDLPLEDDIVRNEWRPHDEIHAYMPGLGETKPFHDPDQLALCRELSANHATILKEYEALLAHAERDGEGGQVRFQSVTSMNYESGWKSLVLFYNGHRIQGFPYHLCETTTRILESVPLAGRIAGFNRQRPGTGIPLHSDGNNMWLTAQLGLIVPDDQKAWIEVGPETRHWKNSEVLLYDTTYMHRTMNEHPTQERVVLHVDFFNTLSMTPIEIEVMRYIYSLREEFLKAEGVAKVGERIL